MLRHTHLVSLLVERHPPEGYRPFFGATRFATPMPGPRSKGDVCAAGFGFSVLGFLFSRLLFW
jgi:hypothetical protein